MWFQKQTRKGRVDLLMKEESESPITLYTPSLEDLWFRQKMMADESYVSKSGVRLFPYYLLAYIMPPLYKP